LISWVNLILNTQDYCFMQRCFFRVISKFYSLISLKNLLVCLCCAADDIEGQKSFFDRKRL
jgi:hypothetical protein